MYNRYLQSENATVKQKLITLDKLTRAEYITEFESLPPIQTTKLAKKCNNETLRRLANLKQQNQTRTAITVTRPTYNASNLNDSTVELSGFIDRIISNITFNRNTFPTHGQSNRYDW